MSKASRVPSRFVGMHAHTGFSFFDGMGMPSEHIDYVVKNGMDAWCLTDHGHMNGFVHAFLHAEKMRKSGVNFKFVPGCEMYLHPDLRQWRQDYELQRAAKANDASAKRKIAALKESIRTPLAAIVDSDDDPVAIEIDSETLTVEDESETKSGKFHDPVKRRHHLVVLPRTSEGLQRLFGLVSRGYKEGFYRFPRIDYAMLKEAAKGGHLLISSACVGGNVAYEVFNVLQQMEFDELGPHLLDDPSVMDRAVRGIGNTYDRMVDCVGRDAAFLELQFNKLPAQHLANRAIIEYCERNNLQDKLIVTCDSHYAEPSHWREREIYKKLGWLGTKDFDPSMLPQSVEELKCELYPKNHLDVWETYNHTKDGHSFYDDSTICEAIERTHDIVHNLIGDVQPDRSMKLPSYVVPEGMNEDKALLELCKSGLISRGLADKQEYIERLKLELRVIKEKQFSKYFLTMKKIIDIAIEHMLIGCGRGSAGGSLVAYVLGITDVDPIEYGLLFERFLAIDRAESPDIDTDVSDRDKLIGLLREHLGTENVVPISNYLTFKVKSLIKDVSKFWGIEFSEVNSALASLERDVTEGKRHESDADEGIDISIEDAVKYSASTRNFLEKHPEIAEPLQVLFKQNRALGRHAGGVIISENIAERMPLITAKGEMQTPWVEGMHYKHLETMGWIKFDLLGLETLRMIERAIELILRKQGTPNPTFHQVRQWYRDNMAPGKIDFDDQRVYEKVYHAGKWISIFQCTNQGSQRLFQAAKPRSIIDLATLTAIYRPGPLGAKVDKMYIKAKANPESIDYGHPLIEGILKDTYGFIIFQEQVMEIANVVAGFPKEECNAIRKMLKPTASGDNNDKAKALQEKFITGCVSNGVSKHIANDLYEKILYFASYGFNKSHSVAYSINSYYCAWLLTHHETEWVTAYLEATAGTKKAPKALSEVKQHGFEIVPIDVNYATESWTSLDGRRFMPSFYSCKGIGEAAVREIMEMRPYRSIEDFLWNEDGSWKHSKCNKRVMEALIKIRSMDSLDIVGEGKPFSSYQHLCNVAVENYDGLKKQLKKEPNHGRNLLRSLLLESEGEPEWNFKQLVENESELMGTVDIERLIPSRIVKLLREREIGPLDDIGSAGIHWFMVTKVMLKKTKTGKPYHLLECISASSKVHRMFCWDSSNNAPLPTYTLLIAEVENGKFGMSTKYNKVKVINV